MPYATVVQALGSDGAAGTGHRSLVVTIPTYVPAGDLLLAFLGIADGKGTAGGIGDAPAITDSRGNTWFWVSRNGTGSQFGTIAVMACVVARGKELTVGSTVFWAGGAGHNGDGANALWVWQCHNAGHVPIVQIQGNTGGVDDRISRQVETVTNGFYAAVGLQVARETTTQDACSVCAFTSVTGNDGSHPTDPDPPHQLVADSVPAATDDSAILGEPAGSSWGWNCRFLGLWANPTTADPPDPLVTSLLQGMIAQPTLFAVGTAYRNVVSVAISFYSVGSIHLGIIDLCTGLPVLGLKVALFHDGVETDQYTDSNGEVLFADLPEGQYVWEAGPDFDNPSHTLPGSGGVVEVTGFVVLARGENYERLLIPIGRLNGCPGGVGPGGGDGAGGSGQGTGIDCAETAGVGTGQPD